MIIAVIAARSRYQRENPGIKAEDLVIYTTTQTHSLGTKAGLALALPVRVLEVQPSDKYSLRGDTLRAALEEDERLGRKPLILSESYSCWPSATLLNHIVATIGTTSSGAVDNMPEIAEVRK